MNALLRHISRCMIGGIVAFLPIGGTVLAILYMENTIADSGLRDHPLYFPGVGLIAAAGLIYLTGLVFGSFLGKWIWRLIDALLEKVPVLGGAYSTIKQLVGYGKGKDAVFHQVVLVPSRDFEAEELGLVTNRFEGAGGPTKLAVFVPGSPNPADGRLLILEETRVHPLDIQVNEAMKALLSVGKTDLPIGAA